jgi:hypothetical protein
MASRRSTMNTFHAGSIFLLCWALTSCANPLTPTIPRASVGDLSDYVLEPLALRVADEKISEASAELKLAHTPKATMQTVASLLNEVPWIGRLLNFRNVSQKAELEEDLAWLETRRIPLKRELLDLFVSRTTQEEEMFIFCVDGVQRRYRALDTNRFTRLLDGPGPCEPIQLYSLKKGRT